MWMRPFFSLSFNHIIIRLLLNNIIINITLMTLLINEYYTFNNVFFANYSMCDMRIRDTVVPVMSSTLLISNLIVKSTVQPINGSELMLSDNLLCTM